jgi:nickel/cobalt transporter (NicO) family protein
VRTGTPRGDPTNGLRRYPKDLLSSPLDRREAAFSVRPGDGTLTAPKAEGGALSTEHASGGGFASLFEDAAAGKGVLVLLLLAALGWGALHALSPGHGKAMVAAYLVGARGTARHAVALGVAVTVTHTIGVFALGAVALALSAYVLPEDLYPWLNLVSGLLVLGVGASVVRARVRRARTPAHHDHGHDHHHDHGHHDHDDLRPRALLAMGASAGLIPCPSALVVLLGAVAQHQIGLGLVLIVAFSAGLAATLTGLGLLVVAAGRVSSRVSGVRAGRVLAVLPALSAIAIVAVGLALTAQAVPKVL